MSKIDRWDSFWESISKSILIFLAKILGFIYQIFQYLIPLIKIIINKIIIYGTLGLIILYIIFNVL